jgi:hypothetical protein
MSNKKQIPTTEVLVAQTVQSACIHAAKEGFQDASMRGLCSEGAIEAAIGAMQSLDIEHIVAEARQDKS